MMVEDNKSYFLLLNKKSSFPWPIIGQTKYVGFVTPVSRNKVKTKIYDKIIFIIVLAFKLNKYCCTCSILLLMERMPKQQVLKTF